MESILFLLKIVSGGEKQMKELNSIKAISVNGEDYELALTNREVEKTFGKLIRGWFAQNKKDFFPDNP